LVVPLRRGKFEIAEDERFPKRLGLDPDRADGVEDDAATVEDEPVLAAGLPDAGDGDPVLHGVGDEARTKLGPPAAAERRRVQVEDERRAVLDEALQRSSLRPHDFLADRDPDVYAPEPDERGIGAGPEVAGIIVAPAAGVDVL